LFKDVTIPESSFASFGNEIINARYQTYDVGAHLSFQRIKTEIEWMLILEREFTQGAKIIESLMGQIPEVCKERARRLADLGKFIAHSARTAIHAKQWYKQRIKLLAAENDAEIKKAAECLTRIAREEIKNAEATIPLVTANSRLGWEPSMEYMCDEAHLRWKIKQVENVINNELSKF
jgi:hypothetical protein